MTALIDLPPVEPRNPGFCSLMASATRRCLKPAQFFPVGWRCEFHKPRFKPQRGEYS